MNEQEKIERARYIATTGKVIWERIIRIQTDCLSRSSGAKALQDLSLQQFNTILTVRRHEPVSMTELAQLLGVSSPSASNMVDRLVEKGALERESSPEDRRKVVISVSPLVVEEIQQVESSVLGLFIGLVERVGPQISKNWCEVLSAVKTAVEAETRPVDR